MAIIHTIDNPPIIVGAQYKWGGKRPGGGWFRIILVTPKYVYTEGVGNSIDDVVTPVWKFPGLVADMYRIEDN
jgi:hypothetical protein